jgi:hypothetical protein
MHRLLHFFVKSENLSTKSLPDWPKDMVVTRAEVSRVRRMRETLETNFPDRLSRHRDICVCPSFVRQQQDILGSMWRSNLMAVLSPFLRRLQYDTVVTRAHLDVWCSTSGPWWPQKASAFLSTQIPASGIFWVSVSWNGTLSVLDC